MKIILIYLVNGQVFATIQISDLLIYKGDTLAMIYSNPLESYFDKKDARTIGNTNFEKENHCTALWRRYVATWQIENDSLFLVNLETDYCSKNSIKIDLTKEFGNNKIFADWVSFEILTPFGKHIKNIHQNYESIYEYERGFKFEKGNLISINNYDNSKSKESIYTKESNVLHQFIYENIDWALVKSQKLTNKKKVFTRFSIGENGKPTAIEIIKGIDPQLDKEAERIIKLIPEWDIYYKRGKLIEYQWVLPIFFDKEYYKKK